MSMMKKSLMICMTFILIIFLALSVTAVKIRTSMTKESFASGERITFTVFLYDDQNNLINTDTSIVIEDAEKRTKIEKTVQSNKPADVDLGKGARAGLWTLTARYQDAEVKEFFTIVMNEEVKFEIDGDKLLITNIGNTRYSKIIDVIIGTSLGTKKVDLNIGEKTSFRLIAPDGTYNVKVTDGKTTTIKSDVALTGKVIGILDEKLASGSSSVTGGVKPEAEADETFYSSIKDKNLVYVFLLVVIGAAVLLAIERNYRKRV